MSKEAKRLDDADRLHVRLTFRDDHVNALEEILAFPPNRRSGDVLVEFESDNLIANRIRHHKTTLM